MSLVFLLELTFIRRKATELIPKLSFLFCLEFMIAVQEDGSRVDPTASAVGGAGQPGYSASQQDRYGQSAI